MRGSEPLLDGCCHTTFIPIQNLLNGGHPALGQNHGAAV
jgi:hypothetical protein